MIFKIGLCCFLAFVTIAEAVVATEALKTAEALETAETTLENSHDNIDFANQSLIKLSKPADSIVKPMWPSWFLHKDLNPQKMGFASHLFP